MNTPILFIIFNRPDTTQKVFDVIRQIKPKQLFVAADGPRVWKEGEKENCEITRNIIKQVDWDCEVKTLFRKENLGPGNSVYKSIDWFFENVEEGIILEHDCLPNLSFFRFCEEMLLMYKNNQDIMHISGNFFQKKQVGINDYYFSRIPHIWGWATWKRAWIRYSFEMSGYINFKKTQSLKKIFKKNEYITQWYFILDQVFEGKLDTWDFQWTYTIFLNNGISINSNKNLVKNIGFGILAENCKNTKDKFANLILEEFNFPLSHPDKIVIAYNADIYTCKNSFNFSIFKYILLKIDLLYFLQKVYKIIKKI